MSKASVSVRIESYSFIIPIKIHIWSDSGFIETSDPSKYTLKQSFVTLDSLIPFAAAEPPIYGEL